MSFTKDECSQWVKNPSVNPKTQRKIDVGKATYKALQKACVEHNVKSRATLKTKTPLKSATKTSVKSPSKTPKVCGIIPKPTSISPSKNKDVGCGRQKQITKGPTKKKLSATTVAKPPVPALKTTIPKTTIPKPKSIHTGPTTTKEEIYKYLKNAYRSDKSSGLYPTTEPNEILDLRVQSGPNSYYVNSEKSQKTEFAPDSYALRTFLQSMGNYNSSGKKIYPKYNRVHGWMFFKNPYNDSNIRRLRDAINHTKTHFKGYNVGKEISPVEQGIVSKDGVIGWNVPFDEPAWLTAITGSGWDPKFNPVVEGTTYLFNKCAISSTAATKALKKLRSKEKNGVLVWSGLYPQYISFPSNAAHLKTFLSSDKYNTCLLGYGKHARFGYKQDNNFYIFDPWKQTAGGKNFNQIRNIGKDLGYNVKFVPRKIIDQGAEGSCVNIALVRAILMAEYGIKGATMIIPHEYAVLGQRLISVTR